MLTRWMVGLGLMLFLVACPRFERLHIWFEPDTVELAPGGTVQVIVTVEGSGIQAPTAVIESSSCYRLNLLLGDPYETSQYYKKQILTITADPSVGLNTSCKVILYATVEGFAGYNSLQVNMVDGTGILWKDLGSPLSITPNSFAIQPRLAMMEAQPVVAWLENRAVFAKTWDGALWQPLGAQINSANATQLDLVVVKIGLDPATPVVASIEGETGRVIVRRWNGTSWQTLGLPLNDSNQGALFVDLAVHTNGRLVAAFSERQTNQFRAVVHVKIWNDTAWQPLGELEEYSSPLVAPQIVTMPSARKLYLGLLFQDTPYTEASLWVREWTGTTWQTLGEITAVAPQDFSLAIRPNGTPLVLLEEFHANDPSNTQVQMPLFGWNGTAWVTVYAPNYVGLTRNTQPELHVNPIGQPMFVWRFLDHLRVVRFEQGIWRPLGDSVSIISPDLTHTQPSLQTDVYGNPIVAWQESNSTNSASIRVRHFTVP
jgi:hypothetical protein